MRELVTNIPSPADCPETGRGIAWLLEMANGRCGHGAEIHTVIKRDFAGGTVPSGNFGANAAWMNMVMASVNCMAFLRHFPLPDDIN